MIRLLIFAITMLILSSICNGQGVSNFGATRAQDTSRTPAQLKLSAYGGSLDTMLLTIMPNGDVKKVAKSAFSGSAGFGLIKIGNTLHVDTSIVIKNGGNYMPFGVILGNTSAGLELIAYNDTRFLIEDNSIKVFNVDSFLIQDGGALRAGHLISDDGVKFSNYPDADILGTDSNGELVDNSAILDTLTSRVFPMYDAGRTYVIGNVVQGTDSNIYRAITTTVGNSPLTDNGSNWELYTVNKKVVLNVPSRFTIAQAKAFSDYAILNDSLTIQIADGTYNLGTTTFDITHPYGRKRRIVGNVATPGSVILRSAAVVGTRNGLLYSLRGGDVGSLEGFHIKGPGNNVTDFGGIFIQNNAYGYCKKVIVDSCYFSFYVANGGALRLDTCTGRYGGDGNAFVYGGRMVGRGCTFSNAYGYFAQAGAVVEYSGSLICFDCNFTNNAGDGIYITNNGSVNAAGSTISGNFNGIRNDGGSIDVTSVNFSGNTFSDKNSTGCAQYYSSNVQTVNFGTSRVGFGSIIDNPLYPIHVKTNSGDAKIVVESSVGGSTRPIIELRAPAGSGTLIQHYLAGVAKGNMRYAFVPDAMAYTDEDATDVLFLKDANLGIGDNSPLYKFTVGSGDLFGINSSGKIDASGGANPANGQILIGDGTDMELANITAGTGIMVTNGAGSITVATNGNATVTTTSDGTFAPSASGHYVFTGTTSTWTLPEVSGTSGRVMFIKNRGSGTVTINATAAANEIYSNAAVNTYALTAGSAIILVSDGSFYNVE